MILVLRAAEAGRQHMAESRRPSDMEGMAKTNPFEFVQQVRSEVAKVTWPTRKETLITTGMVMVMVVLAALFFLGVDQVLNWIVGIVLGLGR
jgi:preprotein translocase subunit SecE